MEGLGGGPDDVGLQLVLIAEVMPQGPGGPAGFGGDAADGHAGQAFAQDHPDGGLADLGPSLVVINESRHVLMVTPLCYFK
ncbi:hypothetical protein Ssi02_41940 [Sinosporangium siamense]|uniref:Uncharacterized protein n=1 Tax=Sinosporangium siamense TaxID=1367973 RepID=A0A919V804_9ACTN|nr:hypothetical protein Ssi02_41940 [Sinosporangium siamense]